MVPLLINSTAPLLNTVLSLEDRIPIHRAHQLHVSAFARSISCTMENNLCTTGTICIEGEHLLHSGNHFCTIGTILYHGTAVVLQATMFVFWARSIVLQRTTLALRRTLFTLWRTPFVSQRGIFVFWETSVVLQGTTFVVQGHRLHSTDKFCTMEQKLHYGKHPL